MYKPNLYQAEEFCTADDTIPAQHLEGVLEDCLTLLSENGDEVQLLTSSADADRADDTTVAESLEETEQTKEMQDAINGDILFPAVKCSRGEMAEVDELLNGIWDPATLDGHYTTHQEQFANETFGQDDSANFSFTPLDRFLACKGPWNPLDMHTGVAGKETGCLEQTTTEAWTTASDTPKRRQVDIK